MAYDLTSRVVPGLDLLVLRPSDLDPLQGARAAPKSSRSEGRPRARCQRAIRARVVERLEAAGEADRRRRRCRGQLGACGRALPDAALRRSRLYDQRQR